MHSVGRALAALGAVALAAVTVTLPVTPATAAGEIEATIGATSAQIEPGDDLEFHLVIKNGTDQSMDPQELPLQLTYGTIDTRFAFSAWLDDEDVLGSHEVTSVEVPQIAAGSTYSSTFEVTADDLGLGDEAATGAYGIRMDVSGASASTFVVVGAPDGDATITLATAAPITSPFSESGLYSSEELTAFTSLVGSLNRQLQTVSSYPISVGIDPMIETSIDFAGDNAPQSALEWATRAELLADSYALPYAMSDQTAQLAAGLTPLEPLGVPDTEAATGADTYFPPQHEHDEVIDLTDRSIDTELLHAVADTGIPLVSTGQLTSEEEFPTPDAGVMIDGQQAIAADAELLRVLRQATSGATEAERNSGAAEALALLTTISREAPYSPRTLATAMDVSGVGAEHVLAELDASGWVELAPLDTAMEAPVRDTALAESEATELDAAMAETVDQAHAIDAAMADFSLIATQPRELTVPFRLQVLAAMHRDVNTTPASAASGVTLLRSELDATRNGVQVLQGSDIHIVGSNVQLPIELVNELEVSADVVVQLRTTSTIVVVSQEQASVTIDAQSSQRVLLPVEVVGSGRTTAIVTLETESGHEISEPVTINVQAQPSIETVIVWLGAAAVVLLIGFGLWRSLRKRAQGKAHGDLDGSLVPAAQNAEESPQQ